jgi:hypothetical protein
VLVGAPVYDDPQLPDVPQVTRNLADLAAVLMDPAVGGFPAGHCVVADPDVSVEQVGDLLEQAALQAEDLLSLGEIYRRLYARLHADGLPLPQQRGTATADLLGLVRNTRPAPPQPAPLTEVIRTLLDSSSPHGRLAGVAELAEWLADADPRRVLAARAALEQVAAHDNPRVAEAARRVLGTPAPSASAVLTARPQQADGGEPMPRHGERTELAGTAAAQLRVRVETVLRNAERAASAIPDGYSRVKALAWLAGAVAVSDPERAERITNTITDDYGLKAQALARLAQAVRAGDPERAERIANQAERIANTITDDFLKAEVMPEIAEAVSDPERAERIANTITDDAYKPQVLARLAWTVAARDPDRAERIANTITDDFWKAGALAGVARVWLEQA